MVAEASLPIANALKKFLEGYADVQVVSDAEEALASLPQVCPEVVIVSVTEAIDGEGLLPQLRKQAPDAAFILAYPFLELERAPRRAQLACADGFLVAPFKKHQVLGMVQAVARLNRLAVQLRELKAKFEQFKKANRRSLLSGARAPQSASDDAFFKKYMLLEIKRSKRYRYPVSMLMVSLDNLSAHLGEQAPKFQRTEIRSEALAAVGSLLRDIDVAMPLSSDRFLLFLPHTALRGATVVAGRVVDRLSKLESFPGGTASVGVSSFEPQPKLKEGIGFGQLVREATEAMKRAQSQGGHRFASTAVPESHKKKSRISMG